MTPLDWLMIALWVVGTSAFGVYFKKHVKTTRDYLLAGRRLRRPGTGRRRLGARLPR